jgi:hypothetical protein
MAQLIPSPPLGADPNSYVWIDWYNQITVVIDQLNELLQQVNTTANSAITAAQDAQDSADAAQSTADAAALSAASAATAASNAQSAAEDAQDTADAAALSATAAQNAAGDAQDAADLAQAAAVTAQEAAALAQALALAAQEQAAESLAPDTYNAGSAVGALFIGVGTASAEVKYNNNGTKERRINGGSYVGNGNWYSPTTASIGDTHWVRFTKVSESGATISGTFGSWLQLNSSRSLSISTSSGEASGVIIIELSTDSSGTPIVATGTITLFATQEN